MKSIYIKFFFVVSLGMCSTGTQAQTNLQDLTGHWKCYSGIQDTLKGCKDCFWMVFDGTTMQTCLSSGTSLPDAVGEKTSYEYKNSILKTQQGKKTLKLKVTVYHPNFISYTISTDGKPETVYLKRELKAH